jgi:hypothetical protein
VESVQKKVLKIFDPNDKHLVLIFYVHDSSLHEVSMIQIYMLDSFPTTQCIDKRKIWPNNFGYISPTKMMSKTSHKKNNYEWLIDL